MAKKATEDMKRAKKDEEAPMDAADEKDDEKDDDEDEDDDKKKPEDDDEEAEGKRGKKAGHPVPAGGKKGNRAESTKDDTDDEDDSRGRRGQVTELPLAANSAAKQIAELCKIAGAPELAADYILRSYTVDKVIEKLSARRAKASAEGGVSSYVSGESSSLVGRESVDAAIEQARIMSANSGGKLTQSQCMERIMRANPEIYNGYLEERGKIAAQVAFTGGGRALTEYVMNNQRRYMANLGLSTVIDDVPGRRPM
jgi:hypothetical protein